MPQIKRLIRLLVVGSILLSTLPPGPLLANPARQPRSQTEEPTATLTDTPTVAVTATDTATLSPTDTPTSPPTETATVPATDTTVLLPVTPPTAEPSPPTLVATPTITPEVTATFTPPPPLEATVEAAETKRSGFQVYLPLIFKYDGPQADFTATPLIGPVPLTVTFVNSSTHANAFQWDFGDGSTLLTPGGTDTALNPTHTYTQPGVYTVTLVANDGVVSHTLSRAHYITPFVLDDFGGGMVVGAAAGSSLAFDGTDDIVRTVDLPLLSEFTVEAWVKRMADSASYETFLSDANSDYSQAMFILFVDGENGDCSGADDQFAWYDLGEGSQCSGVTADLGTWHHIAVSRDNSGTRRLFVDGVLASEENTDSPLDSNGVLTFGRAGNSGEEYFGGSIDEVRISNAAVYTANFTPPTTPLSSTSNTVGLWHFDEGTGQTAADSSGNARNGTLGSSSGSDSADPTWSTDSPVSGAGSTNPVANFSASPLSGTTPLTVTFVNSSLNATSYVWNFGDGGASTAISPTYTYTQVGIYTVTLAASDGSVTNTLTRSYYITASAPSSGRYSLAFDGNNDRVGTVNLPLLTQFTLEAWVKRTVDANTYQTFLSDASSSYSQAMFVLYVDGGSDDCTGPSDQFAYYENSNNTVQCSGVTAELGTWHHLAVARDSSGVRRFFVDGVLRSAETNTPNPTNSNGLFSFGRAGSYAGEYFGGLLDEVRISNVAVYTTSFSPPITPLSSTANTVALWHLDEGAGQTAADSSGNGRNGTLGSSSGSDSADPLWSTDTPVGALGPTPPLTAFIATPLTGTIPLTVTFVNSSTGATAFVWSFGDRVTSTVVSPTHTYSQPGVYTVMLTATGPGGSTTLTRTNYITASSAEIPIAGLNVVNDSPTPLSQATTLTATIMTGSNVAFTWAFGDGTTGSGAVVTHTYPAIGSYSAVVTANNSISVVTATTIVTVTGIADLTIGKIAPLSAVAGEPITYTLTITNSGSFTATNLIVTDTLPSGANYVGGGTLTGEAVNWTIASLPPGSSTTTQFVVTTTETITNSNYQVAADGGVVAVGQEAVVTLVYPLVSVNFTAAPLSGTAPLTVAFTNNSSNASSYLWDFGDGATSAAISPTHTYTQVGVYTVTLAASNGTVTNTLTRTRYITVSTAGAVADFSAFPLSGPLPLLVQFLNNSTGADSYAWDFGDGITATLPSPTHTYLSAGVYTITLTATGLGDSHTLTRTNYITAYEPVVADFAASPLTGTAPLTVTFVNSSTGGADYLWDFGTGATLTVISPTYIYAQPGVYTVTLTASGPGGATASVTRTNYITVTEPVVAAFSATPLTGTVSLTVTFVNSSTGASIYLWDFGDETTSSIVSPTHTYTQTGGYTVTLAASNGLVTDTLTRTNYITVTASIMREWQQITTTTSPPIIGEHSMAYDSTRNVVVLYGGNADGWPYENSTWEFDGTDWLTVTTTTSPLARYGAGLAYDPMRQVMVLFGGSDETDLAFNQTWEYTNTDWVQVFPTTSPLSRTYHSLATNPVSGAIYLFGGNDGEMYFNDLWRYENGDWMEVPVTGPRPPARTLAAITFQPSNPPTSNRLLLFGGRTVTGTLLADLWTFDPISETWTELDDGGGGGGPPTRMAHTLTYDAATGNVVLVGGVTNEGDTLLNDTWHYRDGWAEVTPATTLPGQAYHQAIYGDNAIILFSNGEVWRYE